MVPVSARGWFAFAAVSVLWGIPYFFIKVAVGEVSPLFIAWSRILVGAAVLLPLAWRMGAFDASARAGARCSRIRRWRLRFCSF